ncbi:MAG: hypothetical protein M3Z66_18685 [Chloroflexota bacterium]|nr:hypothetical protein [Chloroflexota bacterium]
MDDRETFEDPTTIQHYLRAVPVADATYRRQLRHQLMEVNVHRRTLPGFRWRVALSAVVVTCIAVAAAILPLHPQTSTTANAYQILSALARGASVPYSGAALITYTVSAQDRAPLSISRDLGRQKVMTHWTVLDSTHFRVDSHVLSPAIESGAQTVVVNGEHITVYNGITGQAVRGQFDPRFSAFWLSVLQSDRFTPPAQTVQGLVSAIKRTSGEHARIVGHGQVMGRKADIIEVRPVVVTGFWRCKRAHPCTPQWRGFGKARLWVDHAHPVLLEYKQSGVPAAVPEGDITYRVTSISFAHPVSSQVLGYRSPVKPRQVSSAWMDALLGGRGLSNGGVDEPGLRWRHIPGFIVAPPPVDRTGHPFTLISAMRNQAAFGKIIGLDGLYVRYPAPMNAPGLPPYGPNLPSIRGPYLYISEHLRLHGLPAALKTSKRHTVGSCEVWTGRYSHTGDARIAIADGQVALLAVGHGLSPHALLAYAKRDLCQ